MQKSSKRLVISTEAKNSYGFRTRTAGIALDQFTKNPLLLWMHIRPKGEKRDEILPLGYWEDLELKDGVISAIPVFDDTDAFAMTIYKKVENGTIKMASAGLKPVEFKEDGEDLWLWLSSMFEASLVDIGSNNEALALVLYNEDYETITLSDVYTNAKIKKETIMTKIKLTAGTATILGLAEGHEMESDAVITGLVTLASEQAVKLTAAETAKLDAESKLKDAQVLQLASEKNAMLDTAEKIDGKITADERPFLLKMETEDLKVYLLKRAAAPSVASLLKEDKKPNDELVKLSWNELHKANKLVQLKAENLEAFKEKFKAAFGREYKD